MGQKSLKKHDSTYSLCFSLYPTTVKSLRSLCGEWGSIGRAIQVAVEILVDRLTPSLQEMMDSDGKKPAGGWTSAHRLEGDGLATDEERRQGLKVPFTFSVVTRTEKQIEWLSHAERYKNRNEVIYTCEGLLADLHVRHGGSTPKKR